MTTITTTSTTLTFSKLTQGIKVITLGGVDYDFADYVSSLSDVGAGLTLNGIPADESIMTDAEYQIVVANTKKLQTITSGFVDFTLTIPAQITIAEQNTSGVAAYINGACFNDDSANPVFEREAANWLYSSDNKLLFSQDKQLLQGAE